MKILHVTSHLGGGVGKAHAAITAALCRVVEQTFILLEEPRDRRYSDLVEAAGAQLRIVKDLNRVAEEAACADIVQIEFWNHPRLLECLACCPFPEMRTVFWSHVSGVSRPVIQPALVAHANRFVFSSGASLTLPYLATVVEERRRAIAVINSGFGFEPGLPPHRQSRPVPRIAYLGTVDFVKMHPGFFSAIDRLKGENIQVSVWGHFDPNGQVVIRARQMHQRGRIHFGGHTTNPLEAMSDADIFFYPLQPDHYGTSENALIEAMSAGLAPVVLSNPAEAAIIKHGETGFICGSIDECVEVLQSLLADPSRLREIGANAARYVETARSPALSAQQFLHLWTTVLSEPAKSHDFGKILGTGPLDWFFSTQFLPHEERRISSKETDYGAASKGTLAHFARVFPECDFAPRRLAPRPS